MKADELLTLVPHYLMQYQGGYGSITELSVQGPTLRHQYTRAHRFRSSLCLNGLIM